MLGLLKQRKLQMNISMLNIWYHTGKERKLKGETSLTRTTAELRSQGKNGWAIPPAEKNWAVVKTSFWNSLMSCILLMTHYEVKNITMQAHTYTSIKWTHSSFLVDSSKYISYAIICRLSMITFHSMIEANSCVNDLQNHEELNKEVKRHLMMKYWTME